MTNTSVDQRTRGIPHIPALPAARATVHANTNAGLRPPVVVPRFIVRPAPRPMVTAAPRPVAAAAPTDAVLGAIQELRSELKSLKRTRSKYRRGIVVSGVVMVASAMVAFAAISGSTTNLAALFGEGYSANENLFTMTSQGALLNVLAVSADGDSQGAAIEMAASAGIATEAISAVHWYYQITMAEAAVNSVTTHANYSVTLYQNGTSLGVLYLKQNTFADASIESGILRWSLGASVPAASGYTVKVLSI